METLSASGTDQGKEINITADGPHKVRTRILPLQQSKCLATNSYLAKNTSNWKGSILFELIVGIVFGLGSLEVAQTDLIQGNTTTV